MKELLIAGVVTLVATGCVNTQVLDDIYEHHYAGVVEHCGATWENKPSVYIGMSEKCLDAAYGDTEVANVFYKTNYTTTKYGTSVQRVYDKPFALKYAYDIAKGAPKYVYVEGGEVTAIQN